MAVTINQNLVDETDILSNERVIDMSNEIDMLDPDETQFFTIANKVGNGGQTMSSKVEWLEDQFFPKLTTSSTTAASGVSSLSVAASTSNYFRAGDLVRITTTGEAFEIVGVDRDVRVFEEDTQSLLALEAIAHRFGEGARGKQKVFLGDLPEPIEESIHDRLAVQRTVLEFRFLLEALLANRGFVGI